MAFDSSLRKSSKLFVCMFVIQICLINSNSLKTERRKVSESQQIDTKIINSIKEQLKAQSVDADKVELYGYASMIDPRTYIQPYQSPTHHQYNNFQQLYDTMKTSESVVNQKLANGYKLQDPNYGYQDTRYNMQEQPQYNMANDEQAMHVIKDYLKKYDMKRYFLKKILGDAYDHEEGHDEGFFGNKHLRRHGTAGMAAKVFGELIGLKIKKTIDSFGETVSDYAKEMTTNGFVSIGNTFSKLFRFS